MSRKEFEGSAGKAFRAELPPGDDRPNPDTMTCLGRWNLTLPGQHMLWDRYSLNLCHLRDCAGITPAKKSSPDVTHEIVVFAVDPRFPENLFQEGSIAHLEPLNHVCQFTADNDQKAVEVADAMVQRLVDGMEIAEPSGIVGARDRFKTSVHMLAAS